MVRALHRVNCGVAACVRIRWLHRDMASLLAAQCFCMRYPSPVQHYRCVGRLLHGHSYQRYANPTIANTDLVSLVEKARLLALFSADTHSTKRRSVPYRSVPVAGVELMHRLAL